MTLALSPSSQRAWIEIPEGRHQGQKPGSPSSQRAWIEIIVSVPADETVGVALLAEGVDRNKTTQRTLTYEDASPSSQRAWIEMPSPGPGRRCSWRRPPRRGRG